MDNPAGGFGLTRKSAGYKHVERLLSPRKVFGFLIRHIRHPATLGHVPSPIPDQYSIRMADRMTRVITGIYDGTENTRT
jgi:hypothetical protein